MKVVKALRNMGLLACISTIVLVPLPACKQQDLKGKLNVAASVTSMFRKLLPQEKDMYAATVKRMYDSILLRHNFNGSILVAKNGEVLLEDYHGYADFQTHDSITPNTQFHLASVSKTFTAISILKLWEEKKLSLEDSVQVYFPQFPYHNITLRMMLNHRSGLPNYVYAMAKDPYWRHRLATNQDMLQFLIDKHPTWYGYPNRAFNYCNTNYALLALVVEKVSGESFPDYLKNNIFTPLGMNNTFVFSHKDSASYKPSYQPNNRPFTLEPMDAIYGDKDVYSTVRDMYLWDQALYNNRIVSAATYEQAIQPSSFEKKGTHNYGMGWRLQLLPNSKIVYHNGWWHGNNNVFTRLIDDTATIIILGNKFNKAIYAGMKIGRAFKNSTKAEEQSPLE